MTDMETAAGWRDIPGYGGKYQCNRNGEVRTVYKNGKTRIKAVWTHKKDKRKLKQVTLFIDKTNRNESVASLVAKTFIGPRPDGHAVHHINGILTDDRAENLEYISRQNIELIMHKRHGRPVVKLQADGMPVERYESVSEAGRRNHMSDTAVRNRCMGKIGESSVYGYDFAWADDPESIRMARKRLGLATEDGQEGKRDG